ncbi:MAG: zinc ribbon domain-containing protein [Candidatus Syntrophosphaera sp.]
MEEQLRTLAKMQKLDDQIGSLRILQEELPQELNELIEHVEEARAKLQGSEEELAGIAKQQRLLESDIDQYKENIKKYETQLSDIKNNKEYKALNSEIAYLKEKISELENQEIELMDAETESKKQVDQDKAELSKAEQALKAREGELRKKIDSLEAEIESLRAQRTELARALPQQLVRQYANLLKNKSNQAVAYALNGACGGCGFVIRPQIRIELQLRNKINYCESCGRILMEKFEDV